MTLSLVPCLLVFYFWIWFPGSISQMFKFFNPQHILNFQRLFCIPSISHLFMVWILCLFKPLFCDSEILWKYFFFYTFLFTGPGRGLASCLAIDYLYSLNGGRPGFALSKLMQFKVLIYPRNFITKCFLSFCLSFFGGVPQISMGV